MKSFLWIRVQDAWCREMFSHQPVHALPSPPLLTLLAASSQRVEPQLVDFVGELLQPTFVARNCVVIEPSPHDRCQPACRFTQGTMHAFAQLALNRNERHSHAFGNAVSSDREPTMSSRLVAHVREAEKVKRLGTSVASSLSLLGRIAAELDQTSFLLVQLQAEFGKACSEHFQACRCLLATFEAHHKSSSPGESHPQALTEPDVNLSAHPAPIVQSQDESLVATARTSLVLGEPLGPANGPLVGGGERIV